MGVLFSGLAFMSPGPFLSGLVRLGSEPPFLGLVRFAPFFLGLVRTASFLGLVRLGADSGLVRTSSEPYLGLVRFGDASLPGLVRFGVASLPGLVRTGADSDGAFAGAFADERSEGALPAGFEGADAGGGFDRAGFELGLLLEDPLLAWKWQPPSAIAKMATLAAGLSMLWMSFIVVVVPLGGLQTATAETLFTVGAP